MLAQLFEHLFQSIDSTLVTNIFIWAVIFVFCAAWWCDHKNIHNKFREYAPTLMGALGILGTFIGIIIGLLNFNTESIDTSIPVLLGGLKTAFITSIVGMFFAILFNGLDAFFFANKRRQLEADIPASVTPEHIHQELKEQNKHLVKLIAGMSGSEEGSIVAQIKLLRNEISDTSRAQISNHSNFSNKLWEQLQQFADLMAKGATEQIIDALRQVIIDFNNDLTEQFGENFKALDTSVKKLVDWQENYKNQVEQMGEQYQQSVESLVETRKAVAGIWEECKEIPLAMAELRDVLQVNQHQIGELSRHLEIFVAIRDKATDVLPEIQTKMSEVGELLKLGAANVSASLEQTSQQILSNADSMRVALDEGTEGFRQSVTQTQQAFASMAHDVSNSSETLTSALGDTITEMKQSGDEFLKSLETHSRELHRNMEQNTTNVIDMFNKTGEKFNQQLSSNADNMFGSMQSSFDKASAGLTSQVKESIEKFGSSINEQLHAFEQATEREMNREMQSLGNALLSISKGFVGNYERLLKEYQAVMGQLQTLISPNQKRG
ncbi:type II Zorya anti-phage system protein ZorA2 [Enterobacter kobei]|uniref:type II Zorya anti-phage system protein ZorA2 n=1 Tax=Enterobacter cloacae complex TaxID=354276 RepID=UPI0005E89E9C|nr:type II Zorya anti-phage system protein ZorA2 [Enterobacter kobei]KJI56238.1 membrane protein [Enterobacter kobei]MBD3600533.1 MotA/TolQ/ExbB proton channel family protein [Enterobacter kobei]MBG0588131.1 MotA/TolQ/ExbB proton channel family protein [Enterobacter kobei]MCK6968271.1 MotA/TolQ/ExbB proton channel family protein [Enterobacter kobei]MCK7023179.1 MotA/TolQ/ExbB proton channel family protein [Enterobacter kobei]